MTYKTPTMKLLTGIPVPPKGTGGRPQMFPLSLMKVGEAFKVPLKNSGSLRTVAWRKSQGAKKFVTRKKGEEIWCWRTK
jgi:hypothetical protein